MNEKESTRIDPYKALPLIKTQRLKFSSSSPFTPTYVQSSVTQSSDPAGIYTNRIQGRQILLENPVRDSRAKKEREEKREKKRKEKDRKTLGIIGKKEAKEKGAWKFDESQTKFELFVPLHHLWLGYMSELLGLPPRSTSSLSTMPPAAGMHAKLVKADFHGSIMTVRQSKNPCLVGLGGIVILETENAFKIVTRKNRVKVLPKHNSIFAFAVPLHSTLSTASSSKDAPVPANVRPITTVLDNPHIEFELHGNQFRFRSAERAGKKFKPKETVEL